MASFIAPLIGGLVGGLGGLFGSGGSTKVNNTTTTNNTNNSTPNFNPLQSALMNQFGAGTSQLLSNVSNPNFLNGYAASGLQNINQTSNAANKTIANNIAARGLSASPAAATAQTQATLNQGAQQSQFLNNLPLLQQSLIQSALGSTVGAFSAIPTGQTQTQNGTTNVQGTVAQQQTNPASGAVAGIGAGLLGPNSSGTGSNISSILNTFFPPDLGGAASAPSSGTIPGINTPFGLG